MRALLLGVGVAAAFAAAFVLVRGDEVGTEPVGLPEAVAADVDGEEPVSARPQVEGQADAPSRGLHCELLRADMRSPAAGRSLQIYSFTPGRMALPEYRTTVRTGADGRAVAGDLELGHYVICGPGASPRDVAPRTARVELADGFAEVILVEAIDDRPVRVEVRSDYAPRYGIAPKVVLTRLGHGAGTRFEQPGVLRPGVEVFELPLHPGSYTVGVLPEGELLPAGTSAQIQVGEGGESLLLHLVENRARVDVSLEGLPADEFPARVHAQPEQALLHDLPERTWWGPYKWHQAEMTLPAIESPRRLLVFGARRTYRATGPSDLSRDRVTVPLEPAVRLVVDVFAWEPQTDGGLVLDVLAGDEEFARVLQPRFGDGYPELSRPALGGELVVPAGVPMTLVGRREDGSEAFRRELGPAASANEPLRVSITLGGS